MTIKPDGRDIGCRRPTSVRGRPEVTEKAVWEDHLGAQGRQVAVLEVNCVQDDLIWRVSKSNQLSRFAGVQTGIGPNFQQIAACVGGEAWLKASVSQCILSGLGTS
jgi:hypothetical protein